MMSNYEELMAYGREHGRFRLFFNILNERGRPVSTGILRSSGHVELLESRKTFRKTATANQELALAA